MMMMIHTYKASPSTRKRKCQGNPNLYEIMQFEVSSMVRGIINNKTTWDCMDITNTCLFKLTK